MAKQHTIIYVMRHIDIGGHIDIPYKKVGITGAGNATLTSRLTQISSTKSPIKAQCIAAWSHQSAQKIENAVHQLLEDSRVEGEWFLDKDDTLVDRMQPIMELLGAKPISIEGAKDSYTKNILQRESASKTSSNQALLGEISGILKQPLRTSMRKVGPTFFGDESKLTYYVGFRKSGNHRLTIGRSERIYKKLSKFLIDRDYDVEQHSKGHAIFKGLPVSQLSEIINAIESEFVRT